MAGRGSLWLFVGVLVLAVPRGTVEGKFRRSDIETEPWAEFPVHYAPLSSQSVLLSKMSWNTSGVFPARAQPGQGGLYSDQMLGVVGSHSGAVGATYGPFSVEGSLERRQNDSRLLGYDVMAELASREFVLPHSLRIQVLFLLRPKRPGSGNGPPAAVPCLRARAYFGGSEAVATCRPAGRSLSCLAQIATPQAWRDGDAPSIRTVAVAYSVHASPSCLREGGRPPLVPEQSLGSVQFQKRQQSLTTIKEDKNVWLHVPTTDVAIGERFQIAVSIHPNFTAPGYVIRAKARRGLRVIAVHPANQDAWAIMHKVKQEGGTTMVTVVRDVATDTPPTGDRGAATVDTTVFSVEFEVENTTASSRLINWRIDYEPEQHITMVTLVPVRQSSGQSIIPIIWADDIVNTAVLNGQRLSVPMSVVTVTQSGQVQNITASAQCMSLDPDVLKVKHDCTAVYVDGTETGGALGKKIRVAFAGREVYREFNVWYPELPLEVVLSDPKLSLLRGWKIPTKKRTRRDAQQALDLGAETLGLLGRGDLAPNSGRDRTAKGKCQLRYQQAKVDVYTRFYAPQANTVPRLTGRKQYLYGDDIRHHVTHHTKSQLRALDPSVIQVEGTRVTGVAMGITQIQVVGQDGEQILGESTITVSDDKAEVIELHVGLVSGLALESVPLSVENGGRDRSLTRVTSRRALFAQFQEAVMDARLEFDDGTEVALQDVDPRHYQAVITTLNPDVVAESPGSTPHHPAVIAVKEGSTTLMLEVTLPLECQRRKRNSAVAFDVIPVNVSFADRPRQWWPNGMDGDVFQGMDDTEGRIRLSPEPGPVDYGVVRVDYDPEEKISRLGGGGNGKSDGVGILSIPIDIPFPYPVDYEPSVDEDDHVDDNDSGGQYAYSEESLSPLEIGMYVVLGIFCVAILAFMVNCVLFMARYRHSKKVANPLGAGGACPQNWVLFGTEFDGRTLPQPHRRDEEEAIPMRDFRDDSNHGDSGSRGEHTCTESEVSIERHSVEEEDDEGRRAGSQENHMNQTSDGDESPCCHGSCLDLDDPGCCVIAEGHVAAPFIPCQCQCQCQCHHQKDETIDEDSTVEEQDEDSECTDTERTPLNPPPDPQETPLAGACCDDTASVDAHSDTQGNTPSETHSDSELRITINPAETIDSSLKQQEAQDPSLDYLSHPAEVC